MSKSNYEEGRLGWYPDPRDYAPGGPVSPYVTPLGPVEDQIDPATVLRQTQARFAVLRGSIELIADDPFPAWCMRITEELMAQGLQVYLDALRSIGHVPKYDVALEQGVLRVTVRDGGPPAPSGPEVA